MIVIIKNKLIGLNILYYPKGFHILQEFYWETLDIVPGMPRVNKFLKYWKENIHAIIADIEYVQREPNWRQEV